MRLEMKEIIFTSISLLFILNLQAQTIINAEKFQSSEDSLVFAFELQYNGTSGNANTNQLSLSPVISSTGKKQDIKLFGGYNILSSASTSILNSGFVHLRHNYKISQRLKTFAFYQLQFNEVLLLTKRDVYGLGLRYRFIKNDSLHLDIGSGAMKELEVLDETQISFTDEVTTNYLRGTAVYSFKLVQKKYKINHVAYYQPYFKNFQDFRLLNDINLAIALNKHLSLNILFVSRYDSKPPSVLKKYDNSLMIGISVSY